ncbi:MAG: hypothetical protein ACPL7G_02490, partial [Chloroflexia bacterium]
HRRKVMKGRGQVLVLLAASLGVIAVAVLIFLALSTLYSVRSHARQSLQVAAAVGVHLVDYVRGGVNAVVIREEAAEQVREVFGRALGTARYGLGADPEEIAGALEVEIHNEVPWLSPYTGLEHQVPTLAARVRVPVRILFFSVNVPMVVETEANTP